MDKIKKIEEFKEFIRNKFISSEPKSLTGVSLIDYLYSLSFDNSFKSPLLGEECDVTDFDKIAKAVVLAEQYYPNEKIFLGEVYEDYLRSKLVQGASDYNWSDEEYIEEILLYEKPHFSVLVGDYEFYPFFKNLSKNPKGICNTRIGRQPVWETLYCVYLISEARLISKKDKTLALELTKEVISLLPTLIYPKEFLIEIYDSLSKPVLAIQIGWDVLHKRKSVEVLYLLWKITEEEVYRERILKEYNYKVFQYLEERK